MKKVLTKKVAIIVLIATLGSFFIYGVVSDKTKYAPIGYNLKMDFAGEDVPTFMADVQERLDKEMITNMNYHTNTTLVIKRANKVFPVIEPILKKYGWFLDLRKRNKEKPLPNWMIKMLAVSKVK